MPCFLYLPLTWMEAFICIKCKLIWYEPITHRMESNNACLIVWEQNHTSSYFSLNLGTKRIKASLHEEVFVLLSTGLSGSISVNVPVYIVPMVYCLWNVRTSLNWEEKAIILSFVQLVWPGLQLIHMLSWLIKIHIWKWLKDVCFIWPNSPKIQSHLVYYHVWQRRVLNDHI